MIVARPISNDEPNLLFGNEHNDLVIRSLDGCVLAKYPSPSNGWTFDELENMEHRLNFDGWDAYLNQVWIGSSEV